MISPGRSSFWELFSPYGAPLFDRLRPEFGVDMAPPSLRRAPFELFSAELNREITHIGHDESALSLSRRSLFGTHAVVAIPWEFVVVPCAIDAVHEREIWLGRPGEQIPLVVSRELLATIGR